MMSFALRLLLVFLCILIAPPLGLAWEQTKTCNNIDIMCQEGLSPLPIAWLTPCEGVYLNETGYSKIPLEDLINTTKKSLNTWSEPSCTYFKTLYLGLTNEDRIGYNPHSKNANIIIFREDSWENSKMMMALTTVTQNARTGELLDADIEFNAHHFNFTLNTQNNKTTDFENTLTHELGHLLGIAHSEEPQATMYGFAEKGETTKSTLHEDDIEAICTIYPLKKDHENPKCNLKQGYFNKPSPNIKQNNSNDNCSITTSSQRPLSLWFFLFLSPLYLIKRKKILSNLNH